MIFVSSTVPLNKIHVSKEGICKKDWFLFSVMIKKKILRRCLNIFRKNNVCEFVLKDGM